MGLDMYLNKKVYIGANYEHNKVTGSIEIFRDGEKVNGIDFNKVVYIEMEFGYWRKANAIHQWFVENVQDGSDNCGRYYVSREKLQELYDTAIKVIQDHNLAQELLPTQSGFFFGSCDYDEWYFEDLEHTIVVLADAINDEDGEYYYSSSW